VAENKKKMKKLGVGPSRYLVTAFLSSQLGFNPLFKNAHS
jgi:hypothetical protein